MTQQEIHNYKCTLSPELLEKAKKELTEDHDTLKQEIQTIRERILRCPGLKPRVDDRFLIKFLRARKFDQERTYSLIINYYTMKKENEDIYTNMTPKCIKPLLDTQLVTVLPKPSKLGETVIVFRPGRWDPEKYPMEDIYRASFLINSAVVESEEAQVNGVRYINDLSDFGWVHAKNFTPTFAKKFSTMIQDAFPMRVKGIHYLHQPSVFEYVFSMIKPFLKEKLRKRLHFLGDKVEGLHEYIDPENLPEEYAGKLPSLDSPEFIDRLVARDQEFEDDAKFGFVSMTIQHQSKKSQDAMENLPGTFKKLNVD
ncbi:alpha-tocopherol transfer protein-like [Haliotis rubra]|uniref:alpha-tocopherol transfer protein-like n=1 Tax=Haliotis rubra TaxID=36100 RepID=UPI001EE53B06|nr:alpha-tocopherol transfer protein-like [Haliotis rubra]XP_046573183.1 alpha-tocopherol transfer protein-like [Haliotis rubra]